MDDGCSQGFAQVEVPDGTFAGEPVVRGEASLLRRIADWLFRLGDMAFLRLASM